MKGEKIKNVGIVDPNSQMLMGHPELVVRNFVYSTNVFKTYGRLSPYFRALAEEHKIYATRCVDHGTFLPPRPSCPDCQTTKMEWVDYTNKPATIKTASICNFAGEAFLDEIPYALGFIQMVEAKTVMSSVVKLSEEKSKNDELLNALMSKRRYLELNGKRVVPRFADKPSYTVRDLWFLVDDKKFIESLSV